MKKMNLTIVLGTARESRQSEHVAKLVEKQAILMDAFNVTYVDVKDVMQQTRTLPDWEDSKETHTWEEIVVSSDAFVFIVPEYNHGYPGEMKLLVDQASTYDDKPVAVCGVSAGNLGGARVIEHLLQLWGGIGAVYARALRFSNVEEIFDDKGILTEEKYIERVDTLLKQLSVYAEALQSVREQLSK